MCECAWVCYVHVCPRVHECMCVRVCVHVRVYVCVCTSVCSHMHSTSLPEAPSSGCDLVVATIPSSLSGIQWSLLWAPRVF